MLYYRKGQKKGFGSAMYAYFKGTVEEILEDQIVLECHDIGYNIFVPSGVFSYISGIGAQIKLYTYTSVKEDAFMLYGFATKEELRLFKQLITVNGIGPKGALAILSSFSVDTLRFAIMAGDVKTISKAPGIGKKTAERLILDLKDKMSDIDVTLPGFTPVQTLNSELNSQRQDAIDALLALGYAASEAMRACNQIEITEDMDSGEILKQALKIISSR